MRSLNPSDYQTVPRPIAVLAKDYPDAAETGRHSHPRAQLLYAIRGVTQVTTGLGAWMVPQGHALWIAPGIEHNVRMFGEVALRTAYVEAGEAIAPRAGCLVLRVSALLEALLVALADEPLAYDAAGRGGHLAALILDEVTRAPEAPFALPIPRDARLQKLCRALMKDPSLALDIDDWAERVAVSRRTLTRRFRQETGLSFGEWRQRLRRNHAVSQRARCLHAAQVAASVGYKSARSLQAMESRTHRDVEARADAASAAPSDH